MNSPRFCVIASVAIFVSYLNQAISAPILVTSIPYANEPSREDIYVVSRTIVSGKYVTLITLNNFNAMNDRSIGVQPYWSELSTVEYDCSNSQSRTISRTRYSGPMTSGRVVESKTSAGTWSSAKNIFLFELLGVRNVSSSLLRFACPE